jgi:hypothetical protein
MYSNHEQRFAMDFPRKQQLLLITALQLLYWCFQIRRLHIELFDQGLGPLPVAPDSQEAEPRTFLGPVRLEQQIVNDSQAARQTALHPILGHMGNAGFDGVANGGCLYLLSVKDNLAPLPRNEARQYFRQLLLTVAGNTGDTYYLALIDFKRQIIQPFAAKLGIDVQMLNA